MGQFFAITGLDGSGKSTVCRELRTRLGEHQVRVVSLWDAISAWGDGDQVIRYFETLSGPARTHFIFHALHASLDLALNPLNTKKPNPMDGALPEIILYDGYWYKYAATELAYGASQEWVSQLCQAFPIPDHVFCLDLNPEVALRRKAVFSKYEQGENGFEDFQKQVIPFFKQIEETKGPWTHITQMGTPSQTADAILEKIFALSLASTPATRVGLTRTPHPPVERMPLRVSVCGVDGSGKTTLIRRLHEAFVESPRECFALRSPQFHEDPRLSLAVLSETFDRLGVVADQMNLPMLKAASLFFSMTLYGSVEQAVIQTFRPRVLVGERQSVLDVLSYAEFYVPLVQKVPENSGNLSAQIERVLDRSWIQHLEGWFRVLESRDPNFTGGWEHLSTAIAYVFSGTPREIAFRLIRLFDSPLPDRIILLTAPPETLVRRREQRQSGEQTSELHEGVETLRALAAAQFRAAHLLKSLKPQLEIHELSTAGKSEESTLSEIWKIADLDWRTHEKHRHRAHQ